ncbi:glycosyltransferase family 87 protein [soil metagenome]
MKLLYKNIVVGKYEISRAAVLWVLLTLIAVIAELAHNTINNYLIFENVFWHTRHQTNLYAAYPAEYFDLNHYGPVFSVLIAPFAVLPIWLGCTLWALANAFFLLFAIRQLPVPYNKQNLILYIALIEMMTAIHNVQFNVMLTGWIILSYTNIRKGNEIWAALFIVAGTMIKLYGIVGLAFIFFSKDKIQFIGWLIIWGCILFMLPMFFSSVHFVIESYKGWYHSLVAKNDENALSVMQDISVTGMIRKFFHAHISILPVVIPAGILCSLPLLRFTQYKHTGFQLAYLAMALISVTIFSTSAESATYVLAMTGVAIWFVLQPARNKLVIGLLFFALILTSLSTTDLFPAFIRNNYIKPYSLKALPCFIVWIFLIIQLLTLNFSKILLRR